MESKYYTPKIEEFRVGFEYEFKYHKDNPDWFTVLSATWQDLDYTYDDYEHQYDGKFEETHRVKYLDRQDIEELGFIYDNELKFPKGKHTSKVVEFIKNEYCLSRFENHEIMITKYINGLFDKLFSGIIKNKSELKELLEKLGINE